MFSIPSFYELGTCSDSYDVVGMLSSPTNSDNPNLSPRSMAEAKAVAASISHKEAERRRRKRINGHIATLKSILPNTIKVQLKLKLKIKIISLSLVEIDLFIKYFIIYRSHH